MKLILAIVNNDDSTRVSGALTEAGYGVTRLSTSAGFLMVGNTTFLIGNCYHLAVVHCHFSPFIRECFFLTL